MKAKTASRSSLDELEAKARHAVEQGRHKEAIVFYKDLLKQERRPQWEQALAEAYRRRAEQVAGKSMWQEAVILWENHAKLCQSPELSDAYLGWLAKAGQLPKLAQLLADGNPVFEQSPLGRRLPEALAVLALQNEKLLGPFPKEHPIPKHHTLIKQALRAYGAGRDGEVEEALRQIPSRSPYRNVRTLLKALLLMGQDRTAGLELLGRIEADSVCRGLARRLEQQIRPAGPDLSAYSELPPKLQTLIGKLNGYGKTQLNLLKDAKKLGKDSNPRLIFNTLLSNRELLGEAACRRLCFGLLVDFPEGTVPFERAFGKLSAFQRKRLLALHEESRNNPPQAAFHWREAIDELAKRPAAERDRLDEALICRHVAELAEIAVPEIAVTALEESLALDPDDQASYRTLFRLHETLESPKEAQQWLEKGLKRFPRDVELLTLAMNAAGRRKAYKKAAGLAKSLLEIDPINSPARQFLLDAHLGHARKQARAGREPLARQELEQARSLDPRRRNAALCFLDGLLALRQNDQDRAAGLLAEGWHLAGGGFGAQFQLNIETLSLGMPLKAAAGVAPSLGKTPASGRAELLGLAALLLQYAAEDKKRIAEAFKPFMPILVKAFHNPELTEEDYFALCQPFARTAQFDLLDYCAKEALRHFPEAASPLYFQIYAKCKGVAKRVSAWDENRLEQALDRAHRANDRRTVALIDQFFRQLDESQQEDFEGELPFGLDDLDPHEMSALMKRMAELERLPRSELLAMARKAMPGLPLQNMPHEGLLEIARLVVMGEFGMDLGSMLGSLSPLGPGKPSFKSR